MMKLGYLLGNNIILSASFPTSYLLHILIVTFREHDCFDRIVIEQVQYMKQQASSSVQGATKVE